MEKIIIADNTYYLLQEAYTSDDLMSYQASAEDGNGDIVQIYWDTVDTWEQHVHGINGQCAVQDCNGWCADESNACDWAKPYLRS